MYVCMYVCACVCMYVCMCVYVYMYVFMYVCMYVCMYAFNDAAVAQTLYRRVVRRTASSELGRICDEAVAA